MKVVLFCGGLGMRLREYSEQIPKPMVMVGSRPILWNVMKYYAHYGHTEFILCLGYKASMIKDYFLHYDECLSNDFTLSAGGSQIELLGSDIQNWKITFVDTGMTANVGQRLRAVEKYLGDDEAFLANYADGLTDLPLPALIEHWAASGKTAAFLAVHPSQTFHIVSIGEDSRVSGMHDVRGAGIWMNGGFFVFKRDIFRYMCPGEDLVGEPFQRLIRADELVAYRYQGFWACMDTFREKQLFDDMYAQGEVPWDVWRERHE